MIYDIVYTVVYVVLAQVFCSTFLKRKELSVYFSGTMCLLWIITVFGAGRILEEALVARILVAIIINAGFFFVLYKKEGVVKTISISVLYYAMAIACEILVVAIHKYFDPDLRIEKLMDSDISIYMGVIGQLIQVLVVFLIRRFFRKVKPAEIGTKLWIVYTVFPLYSLSLIVIMGYSFDGPISTYQANIFTYIACSLLMLNLFIYWFVRQESRRELNAQKNRMEIEHAKGIVQIYDQITKERDILGKREHEFKNTISALQGLIADQQYDKMKAILEAQNTELINHTNVFNTGNRLINTILNTKYAEAREKSITFRFVINDLSSVVIEDRDCITILSNILNNAIEAAEKCPEGKRLLSVKATIEDGKFIFACRNPYIDEPALNLKSKKKDIIAHGYGLNNIKEAVARNNGECFFEYEESEFISVVILPVRDAKLA